MVRFLEVVMFFVERIVEVKAQVVTAFSYLWSFCFRSLCVFVAPVYFKKIEFNV